ncbi:MAG: DUF4430 domain-containing protein [Candidatus Thermoplasmatota archaeon]|nr:DUF4430 domain-containing protein [Candidatus Thermoplasmatota archaeon]
MRNEKSIMAAVIIAASVMVLVSAIGIYMAKSGGVNSEPVTASIKINFGNGTVWTYPNISVAGSNATVFGLLMEAAHEGRFNVEYTYYGQYDSIFVDSIAGIVNGEENNYWQYWMNGEYGIVGADKQPVGDNDDIEWKFTTFS